MQWLMLRQDKPEDSVITTSVQYNVRDFVNVAAKELGVVVTWKDYDVEEKGYKAAGKCIIAVYSRYFHPTEVETILGNASKARINPSWTPRTSLDELVLGLVGESLKNTERDELVKRYGYVVSKNYEYTLGS